MNSFFRRILLSVWLTLILAALVTYFLGRLLPFATDESPQADLALVEAVARDLRDSLAEGVPDAAPMVAKRFRLSFENRLQIFVIDRSDGQDIEGRELPSSVQRLFDFADMLMAGEPVGIHVIVPGGKMKRPHPTAQRRNDGLSRHSSDLKASTAATGLAIPLIMSTSSVSTIINETPFAPSPGSVLQTTITKFAV